MENNRDDHAGGADEKGSCRSIEWYAEGQARVLEVGGVRVTVRFVGRRGRRGRIAITAPPGAVFRAVEARPGNGTGEPTRT